MDKKTLIKLARRELELRIASMKFHIQQEMEAYKQAPDARQTWSDTSRTQIGDIIGALQKQLVNEQKSLELFRVINEELSESLKLGSLARVDDQTEECFFLLVPRGGGKIEITELQTTIYFVSLDSPIGQALFGHIAGEVIEVKTPGGIRRLTVKEIN